MLNVSTNSNGNLSFKLDGPTKSADKLQHEPVHKNKDLNIEGSFLKLENEHLFFPKEAVHSQPHQTEDLLKEIDLLDSDIREPEPIELDKENLLKPHHVEQLKIHEELNTNKHFDGRHLKQEAELENHQIESRQKESNSQIKFEKNKHIDARQMRQNSDNLKLDTEKLESNSQNRVDRNKHFEDRQLGKEPELERKIESNIQNKPVRQHDSKVVEKRIASKEIAESNKFKYEKSIKVCLI